MPDLPATCEEVCTRIAAECPGVSQDDPADCVPDCLADIQNCPAEMQAVLDCVDATEGALQCDPNQDQGLAEAPCDAEHAAVTDPAGCDRDPF